MTNVESAATHVASEEALDVGCGLVNPIRATNLAMVAVYRYSLSRSMEIQRKVYPGYAINVTLSGTWKYCYKERTYDLAADSVTVGFPGEEYGCAHVHTHPNSNLILGLAPEAIDVDSKPLFKKPVMTIDELRSFVNRAAASIDDDDFESLVFEIFDLVSRISCDGDWRESGSRMRVQRMKRFIERHYSDDISLESIGQCVGLNRFTCLRQFKARLGYTPLAYLTRCRVEKARVLLAQRRLSIEEIATACGFSSHSYFCRRFKRLTGVSPSDYRRTEQRHECLR